MIRLGWILQFRMHGVCLHKPGFVLSGPARNGGAKPTIEVEVASVKPRIAGRHGRVPKVVLNRRLFGAAASAGVKPVPKPEEDGYLAPYVWITITVTEEAKLDPALESRLREKPGETTEEVATGASAMLETLRVEAELVAGACAAQFPDAVFEPWSVMQAVWHAPDAVQFLFTSATVQVLPGAPELQLGPIELALTQAAGVACRAAAQVRPVLLAAQWLIGARLARPDTPERFLGMFRVLESLCGLADEVALRHGEEFDKLMKVVTEHDPKLVGLVMRAKAVYRNPPLADRFDALSRKFSRASAEADVGVFVELAKARNDFVHGQTLRPSDRLSDGRESFKVLHEMAHRYLRAVIEGEAALVRE